jgi:hypothetical protein
MSRQCPVLGDEEFRNRLMEKPICVDREHPRYERPGVRPSIDQVLKALAPRYGPEVEDLMKGKRAKDNEPRKVAMYLAKELCDLKLKEIAAQFGTASYGTVGRACLGQRGQTLQLSLAGARAIEIELVVCGRDLVEEKVRVPSSQPLR